MSSPDHRIAILGPQRRPSLDKLVETMGLVGPFATINAGWLERERADEELDGYLRHNSINLLLWHRMQEVFDADPQLAAAHRRRRAAILELQELYVLGLTHTMDAVLAIAQRTEGSSLLRDNAIDDAIGVLRALDAQHVHRVAQVHGEFYEAYPPHEREEVVRHRTEVAQILERCEAAVLTGGHVVEVLDALHLFNVAPAGLDRLPLIAWSAGAMALSQHVVLFNDQAVRGPGCPEMFDHGLALLPDVVLFPSAHQRLNFHETFRMSVISRRFAPSACVPLDPGTRIMVQHSDILPEGTLVIAANGIVEPLPAEVADGT